MLDLKPLPALFSIVLLSGCMNYSEVEVLGIQDAQITRFDGSKIAATVTVLVHNPNDYRISLQDPDVDLYVNDAPLGKATLDSTIVLDRNSTRTYTIPLNVTLNRTGAAPFLLTAALSGSVKLGVKGTVVGKTGLLRKRFPFEVEQVIPFMR